MNIAFAFTWLFNPNVGGTERVTDLLAKEFIRRGHAVHYIYTVKRDTDSTFDCPTDNVLYIKEEDLLSGNGIKSLRDYLLCNNIDVVINQGGVMGTCRAFADVSDICKSVTVIHFDPMYGLDSLFMEQCKLRNSSLIEKFKRIYRILCFPHRKRKLREYLSDLYSYWGEKSNKVVLLSPRFENRFYKVCPNFPLEKLTAIPNPVSFDINKDISNKENVILWVGRMDYRQKRPDLMVKVWAKAHARIPDWKLVMLGDGPALNHVKQLANNLPNIEFPGMQSSKPFFEKAQICSSSSSSEGWGMVLTEAASQGTVPMAFDSYDSVRDIITTELQLVKPYDLDEYADKLTFMATNQDKLKELRELSYKVAEKYNISSVVDEWEKLLN